MSKLQSWTYVCLCFVLLGQFAGAQNSNGYPFDLPFETVSIPFYEFDPLAPQVALRMDYAAAAIENPQDWIRARSLGNATQIELVFSQYPIDSSDWGTSYYRLIHNRLRSLFALDPDLQQAPVTWKLVRQTGCTSELQARQFFHGFVIRYDVTRPRVLRHLSTSKDVERVVLGLAVPQDTSVMGIMDRNRHWKNVLIIMDWTGSMYAYGAQVVLWHKLNAETSGIKHLVLFNDGDRKATWQKQIGRTGGIYHAASNDLGRVIETIGTVMNNGYGGDTPENDLEAVVKGLKGIEGYDEIVLLADNRSKVRDMPLLKSIDKPVRVVLCGKGSGKIHPDYLRIAFKTRGSIHTVEEDIMAMGQLEEGDVIEIEGIRYKVRSGELELFE